MTAPASYSFDILSELTGLTDPLALTWADGRLRFLMAVFLYTRQEALDIISNEIPSRPWEQM